MIKSASVLYAILLGTILLLAAAGAPLARKFVHGYLHEASVFVFIEADGKTLVFKNPRAVIGLEDDTLRTIPSELLDPLSTKPITTSAGSIKEGSFVVSIRFIASHKTLSLATKSMSMVHGSPRLSRTNKWHSVRLAVTPGALSLFSSLVYSHSKGENHFNSSGSYSPALGDSLRPGRA
jgi:hypothetical protein